VGVTRPRPGLGSDNVHFLAGSSIVGVRMVPEPDFACFKAAGLVSTHSPAVELRMQVVMAWVRGQHTTSW
jgi:hypothetical protein